jgi:hypothetical protein
MPPKRTPPKKTRDPHDNEDIRAALEAGRRQPDPPAGGSGDGEEGELLEPTMAERRMMSLFKDMLKDHDDRNALRISQMETALRKEMAAIAKQPGTGVISTDETTGAAGGAAATGTATGPWLKVPATKLPPPRLEFVLNPAKFDVWHASWTAYLETSGVKSIADAWARQNRERSLLQQAFDEDMATWVMRQVWYRDPAVNNYATRVLERIREKIEQEADPRTALAALMNRKWIPGESVDSFWLDIQTQVQYCGLRDEYHTDLILTTLWANNFGDDKTRKEFALNPKWMAAQCYQKAKGLEQVRKERGTGFASVNVGVRAASCLNCGYDSHRNGVCPAQGQTCKACGTVGHFAKHCPMGNVNAVVVNDGAETRVCNTVQVNAVHTEETVDARGVTFAVTDSKPPAARKQDWQEAEYEVGNCCEMKNGDKWVAGTITGSYQPDVGPRVCAVLIDGTTEVWRATVDNVVIRKKCEKGKWVPIKRPIGSGRGPTGQFANQ